MVQANLQPLARKDADLGLGESSALRARKVFTRRAQEPASLAAFLVTALQARNCSSGWVGLHLRAAHLECGIIFLFEAMSH